MSLEKDLVIICRQRVDSQEMPTKPEHLLFIPMADRQNHIHF
jgi:hypothetical protein